jgi:hypothetical protein
MAGVLASLGLGLFLSSFVKTSCEFSQKAPNWLHTLASGC